MKHQKGEAMIYLDTARFDYLSERLPLGIFEGITTNPKILSKEPGNRESILEGIVKLHPKSLFVQLVGDNFSQMMEDYYNIKELENKLQFKFKMKVPITVEGIKVIKRLKSLNEEILGTVIYGSDQAILASIAGCDYLAPYVNRMITNDIDAFLQLEQMRQFIDDHDLNTKIIAASFKRVDEVMKAYQSGAHFVTIGEDVLDQMLSKKIVFEAVSEFNRVSNHR